MTDPKDNGWLETYIREGFKRNDDTHAEIAKELASLRDLFVRRDCVDRGELHSLEGRILEVEKMIENFKGRFYILAGGIGIAGAIASRLLSFILTSN